LLDFRPAADRQRVESGFLCELISVTLSRTMFSNARSGRHPTKTPQHAPSHIPVVSGLTAPSAERCRTIERFDRDAMPLQGYLVDAPLNGVAPRADDQPTS
jgi:hypothetical protein